MNSRARDFVKYYIETQKCTSGNPVNLPEIKLITREFKKNIERKCV